MLRAGIRLRTADTAHSWLNNLRTAGSVPMIFMWSLTSGANVSSMVARACSANLWTVFGLACSTDGSGFFSLHRLQGSSASMGHHDAEQPPRQFPIISRAAQLCRYETALGLHAE